MSGALVHHLYRLRAREMVPAIRTPSSGHCSVSVSLTANEHVVFSLTWGILSKPMVSSDPLAQTSQHSRLIIL